MTFRLLSKYIDFVWVLCLQRDEKDPEPSTKIPLSLHFYPPTRLSVHVQEIRFRRTPQNPMGFVNLFLSISHSNCHIYGISWGTVSSILDPAWSEYINLFRSSCSMAEICQKNSIFLNVANTVIGIMPFLPVFIVNADHYLRICQT